MSDKQNDTERMDGWDALALILMLAIVITTTLVFSAGLSFVWPLTFLFFLFEILRRVGRKKRLEEEKANAE